MSHIMKLVAEFMFVLTISVCIFVFMLLILGSFGLVEPLVLR